MGVVPLDSSGSRTGDAPVSFAVLISDDGVAFEVVASGNGDADGITTVSFDVRTARFFTHTTVRQQRYQLVVNS